MDIVEKLRSIDCSWSDEGEIAAAAADEIEMLRDYIAKHKELWNKQMLELAQYQAKENKVGIKRAKQNVPASSI